ncbi:hypothetical protein JVU11DRAFT_6877 [Chiua virens]|nr:hypothetical protein JVU11DRAFT_6877 [Chiua virens]
MKFEWHGNQLAFKKGASTRAGGWITTIELPLRKPSPVPRTLDLLRFLATSITFMAHLRKVQVYFDNRCVGTIEKKSLDSQIIDLPKGTERGGAKMVAMNMEEVQRHRIIIKADVMHPRYKGVEEVDLSMFTADVTANVNDEASKELFRCMKKEPPTKLEYSLIYDDHRSHSQENQPHEDKSILQGLRADLNGARHTRIFIGHATTQTTGIAGHMASRFIPTVERELIDFSDATSPIFQWNVELLHIGGTLCRAVYEWELSNIQQSWMKGTIGTLQSRPTQQFQNHLNRQFRHVLRFFTFHPSAPSPKVAELLRSSFYGCSSCPLPLLSTVGVRGATDIRAYDQNFVFLRSLPMLSSDVIREPIITSLPDAHKIRIIDVLDVQRSLLDRPVNEDDLVLCLQWWIPIWQQRNPSWTTRNILQCITLKSADGRDILLSSLQWFIDGRVLGAHIPRDGPLPELLLPLNISQRFSREDLASMPHWQEFTVPHWLQHLSNQQVVSAHPRYDLTTSPDWAGRVLGALSRLWASLPSEIRREIREMLKTKSFIPTIRGLCLPEESYLPVANDNPFDTHDLAIVAFKSGQPISQALRTLLTFLGVRGYVPPDLILSSVAEFIRYLAQAQVSPEEIEKLKSQSIFTKKVATRNASDLSRCRASDLYPPEPIFLELQLPVIDWDWTWSNESAEARLLYDLGLRPFPSLEKIIELCSSGDTLVKTAAFPYFCKHLESQYSDYDPHNFRDIKFIPAENSTGENACWGTQWKTFGFSIANVPTTESESLLSQLGIQQHPSSTTLLKQLEKSSQDEKMASQWFECLVDCIPSLGKDHLNQLSHMTIVPTRSSGELRWAAPAHCFLGQWKDEFARNLFSFVKFTPKANQFLTACGAKDVPSLKDVAESLVHEPDRFFKIAGGRKGFLAKLGELAAEAKRTPDFEGSLKGMVSNHTLLGVRRKTGEHNQGDYELRRPDEIVIIDDTKDAELFNQYIWTVPEEDLESFYALIGCKKLSEVIQSRLNDPADINDRKTSDWVKELILERLPIFLERCTNDKPKMTFDHFRNKLEVRACDVLRVSKTFMVGEAKTETQNVWAATRDGNEGEIELWISCKTRRDVYDLAISLCRCIFGTVRNQDTLVLAAMFSDRELLKFVGHNAKLNGNSSMVRGSPAFPGSAIGGSNNAEPPLRPVIPQKRIKNGVKLAITCSSTETSVHRSMAHFLDLNSCWSIDKLQRCGNFEGIEIYATKEVPADKLDALMKQEHEFLKRFAGVVTPLAEDVFKVQRSSLGIFFGLGGGPNAFNREGKIYLNLHHFKEWHDDDVKSDKREQAQLSWFFTIAHEIAHNLIEDHNPDHEFWFAAICAEHVAAFSEFRQSQPQTQAGAWWPLKMGSGR